MGFRRVSEAQMHGKGNLGRPDTPGVSTTEMQRIMDELPREVLAPAINELADQLEAETAAGQLGAQLPGGGALPEQTPATVQGVLDALLAHGQAHEQRADNPHAVTAAQVGAYTKGETDAEIDRKVVEIGAADMTKAVYDPMGRKEDIFAVIDTERSGLETLLAETAARLAGEARVFSCTLPADGWEQETPEGTEDGGQAGEGGDAEIDPQAEASGDAADGENAADLVYTQTVPCPGLLAAYDLEAPQVPVTGVRETDAALKEGLDALCEAGNCGETLDGYLKWTCYGSCPTVDLPLRLRRTAIDADENGSVPIAPDPSADWQEVAADG